MGIQSIGKSIFTECANYAKACGKSSILMTKPVSKLHINPFEIKSDMVGDQLVLSVDKTLNPEFLKSLLDIKGTALEKVTQIKDKMLTLMGYDSKLLRVECRPEVCNIGDAGLFYDEGVLGIAPELSQKLKDYEMIALIRHELDHFDKVAKIIKDKGIETYKKALIERFKNAGQSIESMQFNEEFWTKISKNAKTTGFDADKYIDAIKYKGVNFNDPWVYSINYYNNALEESAYMVQQRVFDVIAPGMLTVREAFPCGMKNIEHLLSNTEIPVEKRQEMYTLLFGAARVKNEPNVKELYRILTTKMEEATKAEIETITKLCGTIPNRSQYQQYFKQVDDWLAQGITKIEDIPV